MRYILYVILIIAHLNAFGQDKNLSEIKNYDFSDLWTLSNFEYEFEAETTKVKRQEPLGCKFRSY